MSKICCVCNSSKRIQLHHITYVNLGNESFEDVIPLCGYHHNQLHLRLKYTRGKVENSLNVVELIKREEFLKKNPIIKIPNQKSILKRYKKNTDLMPECNSIVKQLAIELWSYKKQAKTKFRIRIYNAIKSNNLNKINNFLSMIKNYTTVHKILKKILILKNKIII